MKLPIDNLSYPVKLIIGNSTGSGFIVKEANEIYLVTAKHVLYQEDAKTKTLALIGKKMNVIIHPTLDGKISITPRIYEIDLETLSKTNYLKAHTNVDVVVIKLGSVAQTKDHYQLNMVSPAVSKISDTPGLTVYYDMSGARCFDDVEITNDIFVLGYPSSLSTPEMNQIDYNSPLARKGIIGGKNNLNKTLIIDCPVYGGNSGGLVLEINQDSKEKTNFHLVGVVVQFIPFVEQWQNLRFPELHNTHLQNSGYSVVVPADHIFELIKEIESEANH